MFQINTEIRRKESFLFTRSSDTVEFLNITCIELRGCDDRVLDIGGDSGRGDGFGEDDDTL